MNVARRVREVRGLWTVSHPFTGRAEYATTERLLAEEVAAAFDKVDPVTVSWLYGELFKLPPHLRRHSEWVIPLESVRLLQRLVSPDGMPLWHPASITGGRDMLLGLPLVIDDHANGICLRPITTR